MPFDDHKNFAFSNVAVAPSPAASGTELTVTTGEGVKFPAPPFNATASPEGEEATSGNSEIIRVTDISDDVLTIEREQEDTSEKEIAVGWRITASITAKTIKDVEDATFGTSSLVVNEVPSGSVNGSNALFTLSQGYVSGSLMVYRDGQLMYGGGNDYTETDASAGTFTFATAPETGSVILVTYKITEIPKSNADTVDGFDASYNAAQGLLLPFDYGWYKVDALCVYSSADDPTYVMTSTVNLTGLIYPGVRIEVTQGASVLYFICTKFSYSGGTSTVTMYGGTDYNLANATIDQVRASSEKAPYGFPLDPDKWTVEVADASEQKQLSPTADVWYNVGTASISIPIGSWRVYYFTSLSVENAGATNINAYATLSTANNSESDNEMTTSQGIPGVGIRALAHKEKFITINTKASYYLNLKTGYSGVDEITRMYTIIRAICAYL